MSGEPLRLNLAGWQERSVVNGPGTRFVLWVQGCPLACPGCFSPETHPFEVRQLMGVDEVADMIQAVADIEGVTYSGGEPTIQAHGLSLLTERLRASRLTVVCYTGYTIETLRSRRDPWVERLLSGVDILIDGAYVAGQAAHLPWRGSCNQRVHFLSDAYRALSPDVDRRASGVEFTIGTNGFTASGIWPPGLLERLDAILKR